MIDLSVALGIDKKTEKNIMRLKEAHDKISKRLTEKEQMDFNNFIADTGGKVPHDVTNHFRGALTAFADCEKFKIPSMRRQAESKVIEAIQLDLKRVASWWVPAPNFKLFTLLQETESLLAEYLNLESKFPEKYMKEAGKERGLSKEFVREKIDEMSKTVACIGIEHKSIFINGLLKKLAEPMSYLSSSAVAILKYNDTFVDYDKLSKEVELELIEPRKKITFNNIELPDWLNQELFFNSELRIREVAMQKLLSECTKVFDKKIITSLKGTLTRLDKMIVAHKKLIITGEC